MNPNNIKKLALSIPILSTPDIPLVATTLDHLPIAEILDDMVIYKDGGAAIVLESTSLNFGLLSEREQEAVIAAYAALLNSLSFSIEVVIRSQRKDISNYLNYLEDEFKKATNPKIKAITENYKVFIRDTIKKKNVLGKRFFIVLAFSALELGVAKSMRATTTRSGPLPFTREYVMKKAKITLNPRKDHIVRQAGRLGLKLHQLTSEELIELYYEVYNPKVQNVQKLEGDENAL